MRSGDGVMTSVTTALRSWGLFWLPVHVLFTRQSTPIPRYFCHLKVLNGLAAVNDTVKRELDLWKSFPDIGAIIA